MKKLNRLISIAICLSLIGGIAFAQPAEPGRNPQVRLLESTQQSETKVQRHMDNLQFTEVQTSKGVAQVPTFSEWVDVSEKGMATLPILSGSLAVSDTREVKAEVVSSKFIEKQDVLIAPSKSKIMHNEDPRKIPYTFGQSYSENKFFPGEEATLSDPFIVRDILLTPVSNLAVSAEGNTVTLKWDAPNFDDDEVPTNYTYTVSRNLTIVAEGLTATTFSESNLPADLYIYCVQVIYPESESIIKCVDIRILNPVTNLTTTQDGMNVVLRWMAPGAEDETVLLEEGFESGIPATWTTIDADGDGNGWTTTPPPHGNSFAGHNGGATASSASYINNVGPQTPDNYLVTPLLNLANGGTLTFWVCAQDARMQVMQLSTIPFMPPRGAMQRPTS